jgi:hypothetical protein
VERTKDIGVPWGQQWVLGFIGFHADEGGQGEGKLSGILWLGWLGQGNVGGGSVLRPHGGEEGGQSACTQQGRGSDAGKGMNATEAVAGQETGDTRDGEVGCWADLGRRRIGWAKEQ